MKKGGARVLSEKIKSAFDKLPLVSLYLKNERLRINISLFVGMVLNLGYVALNVTYGVIYDSLWYVSIALYYALLTLIRYTVLRENRRAAMPDARRACLIGGILFIALDAALAYMVYHMLTNGTRISYRAEFVTLLSLYSAFSVVRALIGVFSPRAARPPLYRAGYAIRLTSALVSIFNLITATATGIGAQWIVGGIGIAVIISVLILSFFVLLAPRGDRDGSPIK
jgi:hypothetical protein